MTSKLLGTFSFASVSCISCQFTISVVGFLALMHPGSNACFHYIPSLNNPSLAAHELVDSIGPYKVFHWGKRLGEK